MCALIGACALIRTNTVYNTTCICVQTNVFKIMCSNLEYLFLYKFLFQPIFVFKYQIFIMVKPVRLNYSVGWY